MELCENVRCWRWQRPTGAFRTTVGVILLWLSLAQSASSQGVCPAAAAPLNVTQPQYQDTDVSDTGAGFMAALVHSFLNTVQSKPFPKGEFYQKTPGVSTVVCQMTHSVPI